jgi:hypothetical protein
MKANEGKKKPAMRDKKHHDHVPSYLKNDMGANVSATADMSKHK